MAGMICASPARNACSAGQPAKVIAVRQGVISVSGASGGRIPDCNLPRKVQIARQSYSSDDSCHSCAPQLPRSDIDSVSIPESCSLADLSSEASCPLQCPVKMHRQESPPGSGKTNSGEHTPLRRQAGESAHVASIGSPNKQPPRQDKTTVRDEELTTVMMCGVPFSYTRDKLIDLFGSRGFSTQFDFIHMPINFSTTLGVGYVFVNFIPEQAKRFMRAFDGFDGWESFSKKACVTRWSDDQGLEANIGRYRNSPIMGDSVPHAYKPALFRDGVQVPFPAPTKKLRALRCKREKLLSPSVPAWD
ncbi:unnamed protein product [Prorocentrum cordatum]|uniref:Mei2-like C-terminal RNA recognition motif domain-containing protein n=1 Tax=Prorocentrum cordatum TaxID=2364126 RepID=A0ABN9SRA7_9DINO|nr:unnamed protein product [Polarella glacialis]